MNFENMTPEERDELSRAFARRFALFCLIKIGIFVGLRILSKKGQDAR